MFFAFSPNFPLNFTEATHFLNKLSWQRNSQVLGAHSRVRRREFFAENVEARVYSTSEGNCNWDRWIEFSMIGKVNFVIGLLRLLVSFW